MEKIEKLICVECGLTTYENMILKGANPFEDGDELMGCPKCKSVNPFIIACDERGCWERYTCVTPTSDGYRTTCGKHVPKTRLNSYL